MGKSRCTMFLSSVFPILYPSFVLALIYHYKYERVTIVIYEVVDSLRSSLLFLSSIVRFLHLILPSSTLKISVYQLTVLKSQPHSSWRRIGRSGYRQQVNRGEWCDRASRRSRWGRLWPPSHFNSKFGHHNPAPRPGCCYHLLYRYTF